MSNRNIEAIYQLSPMQKGMLFHSIYAPDSGVYVEQLSANLRGQIDVLAFEKAWRRVVQRHTILRTGFTWKNLDRMLQVVSKKVDLQLQQRDWRDMPSEEQQKGLSQLAAEQRRFGFDLAKAPLMRLHLIRMEDDLYHFLWVFHHLLLDGWSMPLLLTEVFVCYDAFSQRREPMLPSTKPYQDYIRYLQELDSAEAEAYWRRTLAGFTAPTPFRFEQAGSRQTAVENNHYIHGHFSHDVSQQLKSMSRQQHLTINTILQGAWALLLNRYSNEDDVLFGATVSGRPTDLPAAESMVGLFINSLPVRVQVSPNASIAEWLRQLQVQQAEMRQYEHSSLVQVQSWSDVPRGQPLFESLIVFENYPVDEALKQRRFTVQFEDVTSVEQTNYPITLAIGLGEQIGRTLAYEPQRFNHDAMLRLLGHLEQILTEMAANPEQKLAQVSLLTGPERETMLTDWNATQEPLPKPQLVHEQVAAQAQRLPDKTAVVFGAHSLSYRQLDEQANQLAHHLRAQGIGPEKLVGIKLDRSVEMIVATLAVLKAGGAFVPLDSSYPPERLAYMIDDAGIEVLITTSEVGMRSVQRETRILDLAFLDLTHQPVQPPAVNVDPDNLAYVIYTSGSTGQPKGTLLNHKGLVNFCRGFGDAMGLDESRRVLQFASFSFDAAVGEIYLALTAGATLVLTQRETLLSETALLSLLQSQRISTATLTPAIMRLLPAKELSDLVDVLSVGDACTSDIVTEWAQGRQLYNGYGPTENTVGATLQLVDESFVGEEMVPIGYPQQNIRVHVLDRSLNLCPVGVPGELYIGGMGLARGYHNRPDLTAEHFIPDPFGGELGGRLYKSGDLTRYRIDGSLDFLGRIDHQVKVRGFRIELDEIEATIHTAPHVKEAAVIAFGEEGKKRLVGYVAPESGQWSGTDDEFVAHLRAYLADRLPDFMIPPVFVVQPSFPLTLSGKIDRNALPEPDGVRINLSDYVAPRTPAEELLADIWAQVLGVERVGLNDNFFDLGGHSLVTMQLVSRIRKALGIELPLAEVFQAGTLAEMAELVEREGRQEGNEPLPPIEPMPRKGDLPLSFAQQRLWFLDQLDPDNLFYNILTAVRLQGELDIIVLQASLQALVQRHESLRTVFAARRGEPMQVVLSDLELPLEIVDLTHLSDVEREAEARKCIAGAERTSFDLAVGPLLRAQVLKLAKDDHIAVLVMHHIISDGWSMTVLINEFISLYEAFSNGQSSPLPPLSVQYVDYAIWQHQNLIGPALDSQLNYWKQQLAGAPPLLDLPTDYPRPPVQTGNGANYLFKLPAELSQKLVELSRQEGVTLFMTLLAGYQILLSRYSGEGDISVGSALANRTWTETESLIGFFVNNLVFRTDLSDNPTFVELLRRVRNVSLQAYANQAVPFDRLVDVIQPERNLSHNPLFQVAFALQNVPAGVRRLPGLTVTQVERDGSTAQFDLLLMMSETPDGLHGAMQYNTDLFEAATIERMMGHLHILLAAVVEDSTRPIGELPLLTSAERQLILVDWNDTTVPYPDHHTITQLFEEQVQTRPDAIAALFIKDGQEDQLTYETLNRRANQLAHHLREFGVGPDVIVGIAVERSLDMVVGILGILKAGGAYLPIDPNYPAARVRFMLKDSGISVLVSQQHLVELLAVDGITTVLLDADWPDIALQAESNLDSGATADHLAYVIYTSGSTGKPKGTLLRHRGLCNLADVHHRTFDMREGKRVLQFSPFSFDASVWELVMALRNGATLCLTSQETLASGPALLRMMGECSITTATLPPSLLAVLDPEDLPNLETVVAAGEHCSGDIVARWTPGRRFFNAYGPTETTVCASMYLCDPDIFYDQGPPIGRPISNFKLYILDSNLQPVPIGVPGELHVGGVGLAKGYLGRPEVTSEKFIHDPFGQAGRDYLYKTGDLVRYLPDGNIEFLGRIDHQVKVRGFRIELGEIETALGQHPAVQESAVLAREDKPGDKRLVGYYVSVNSSEPTASELKDYLREQLPEYMVPDIFIKLELMPLTPSAKIDRAVLPAPDATRPELEREYVAPTTPTEETLAGICEELLAINQISIYDSFFDLGGHSLLATQLISRLREASGIELPLRTIFEHPSVAELAVEVDRAKATQVSGTDTIADLMAQIGQLSEEEVQALLQQKLDVD